MMYLPICNHDDGHIFHLTHDDEEEEDILEVGGRWRNVVEDEGDSYADGCYCEAHTGVVALVCS